MRTTRDLVLVKIQDASKKAGIIVPESAKEENVMLSTVGEAIAVGPECKEVKKGDTVHYISFVGHEIKDESLKDGIYLIVAEKDILCVK